MIWDSQQRYEDAQSAAERAQSKSENVGAELKALQRQVDRMPLA